MGWFITYGQSNVSFADTIEKLDNILTLDISQVSKASKRVRLPSYTEYKRIMRGHFQIKL